MGFLNHSTNNVIIDAVLTEKGRELLSNNDNSFSISRFRLGDDEVDYSILKKYGLIIGKEKIEKNTPVFEAVTDKDLALKYPVRTFIANNTNSIYAFPFLKLISSQDTSVTISSNSSSDLNKNAKISFKTFLNQDRDLIITETGLVDSEFIVKMFNKIIKINELEPDDIRDDIAYYVIPAQELNSEAEFDNQRFGQIVVTAIGKTTNDSYKYYATSSNSSEIKTQIEIIGNNSKSSLIFPVTITSN
jgi:hypothetical protein